MNKNQIEGLATEADGNPKAAAGVIVGNKKLESTGNAKQVLDKVQTLLGDLHGTVKQAISYHHFHTFQETK